MNGVRPKLLIFINTLQSGGAERVVSLLLEHLKDDFEIHLGLYTNIIDYTIPPEIKILNLHQPLLQNKVITVFKNALPWLTKFTAIAKKIISIFQLLFYTGPVISMH